MINLDDLHAAQARIRGVAVRTPLVPWLAPDHAALAPRRLYIKPENLQPIGAFKLRGAYNKLASLSDEEKKRGVITYSSGNHAQGVAYAAKRLGMKAVIVMPNTAPKVKVENTRALGAEVVLAGATGKHRQELAESLAREQGYVMVPPYNDEKIIAGQGTIGMEILEDLPSVECVLVPVGGGGLVSGVATAIKLQKPTVKVIGVEPALAADAQASFKAGKITEFSGEEVTRTIADGLRAQSVGEIPFEHIRRYLDDVVTVTEDEILKAVKAMALSAHLVPEPSGAVTLAAWLYQSHELPSGITVAVLSGGNTELDMLQRALATE